MPEILDLLEKEYPGATIALEYATPLECVVAVVLSAQSTDIKVNEVTTELFRKYKTPEDYLAVPEEELQTDIRATGFFRQKTKSLRGLCQMLLEDFDGNVPRRISDLVRLPGVARKTANVVQSALWPDEVAADPEAGIAVDTHVGRLAVRLGLSTAGPKDADKVERDLMKVTPKQRWPRVAFLLIEHGRKVCDARRPRCEDCAVEPLCPSSQEAGKADLYRVAMDKRKAKARSRT